MLRLIKRLKSARVTGSTLDQAQHDGVALDQALEICSSDTPRRHQDLDQTRRLPPACLLVVDSIQRGGAYIFIIIFNL